MGVYGKTAVAVAKNYCDGQVPRECWEREITQFTSSPKSRKKGCPRSAFLGLCQDGFVKNISKGNYIPEDNPNKEYAITAANLVLGQPNSHYTKADLWHKSTAGALNAAKNQNGQMDVVLALKEAGLLKKPN